ncbi:MAG: DUF3788 domain-containing protein [Actinobacteria bacterium]|nr:DUF3788 domain-containing protein [Actinomycetota bacterium]
MLTEWVDLFASDRQPSETDIAGFIETPLWEELNSFLRDNYKISPTIAYSKCSGQPGWNVKYQKAGRSLCTLYPMSGYFIALVVIGNKEYDEAMLTIRSCTHYTQELFRNTPYSAGGKWLMINVTDKDILEDAKRLIQVRRKI